MLLTAMGSHQLVERHAMRASCTMRGMTVEPIGAPILVLDFSLFQAAGDFE
jgi:hypothetical protein